MPKKSKTVRVSWSIAALGAGVGCVVALIQGNGFLVRGNVTLLGILGTLFFFGGATGLRLHEAPFPIGTPIRVVILLLGSAGLMTVVCWHVWPMSEPIALNKRFHVIGEEVAFNSKNPNQLIANIYIENDGDDAEIAPASAWVLANPKDEQEQAKVIDELRRNVPKKGDVISHINAHQKNWFTVFGPILSPDQREKYLRGESTFYFAGKIAIGDSESLEFCDFVVGDNPNAVVQCPVTQAARIF